MDRRLRLVFFFGGMFWQPLFAQLPPRPSSASEPLTTSAATRLEQLEATYRDNLRERHKPLIQRYINELRLAQANALSQADKAEYAAEMGRVAKIVANDGIVPTRSKPTDLTAAPKTAGPTSLVTSAVTLTPKDASPPSDRPVVILGECAWQLPAIAAGTYDVVAEYTCTAVPPDAEMKLVLADRTNTKTLRQSLATKDDQTVRIIRIGRLMVDDAAATGVLKLSATGGTQPYFAVRRVTLSKADSR